MSIKIRSTKLTLPLLLTLIISGVCSAEPPLPDGRRFRRIVADKYPPWRLHWRYNRLAQTLKRCWCDYGSGI